MMFHIEPKGLEMKPSSERLEQMALIEWATLKNIKLVHIPNEGERLAHSGAILKKMGLSMGFPDLALYSAHGGYFGFFLEMKQNRRYRESEKKTKTWQAQEEWLVRLTEDGYFAKFAFGWEEGKDMIEMYLKWNKTKARAIDTLI